MGKRCCNCHFIGKTNRSATLWKFRKSDGEIIWTRALQPELDPTGTFIPDITHGNSCYLDGDGIVSVGGDGSASEDRLVVQRWDNLIVSTKQWQRDFTGFDGFSNCYCRVHGGYIWIVNTDGKVLTLNAADGTTVTQSTISAPQYYYHNGRIWLEPGSTSDTIQIGPFVEYDTSWSQTQAISETVSSAYLSGSTYGIIYSDGGGTPILATVSKSDLSTATDVYVLSDANSTIVGYDGSTFAIYQPGSGSSIGVSSAGSLLWTQFYRVGVNNLGTTSPDNGASQVSGGNILFNGDKFSLSTGADLNGGGWTGLGGRRQQTDGTYTFFAAGDVRAYNVSDGTQAWTYSHPSNAFYDMWMGGNYLYAASYAATVSSA